MCRGSRPLDRADALTADEVAQALAAGAAVADEEIDGGAELLIPGDMGIGNTTSAAALVARMTGGEVAGLIGRGTGNRRRHLDAQDRRGAGRGVPLPRGSARPGAGPAAGRGRRHRGDDRVPGPGRAAAHARSCWTGSSPRPRRMLAERLHPGSKQWWWAGHRSTEPAQRRALAELELAPLLDLRLRLGEGTGALLALGLVHAAVAIMRDMATFESAGVATRPRHRPVKQLAASLSFFTRLPVRGLRTGRPALGRSAWRR